VLLSNYSGLFTRIVDENEDEDVDNSKNGLVLEFNEKWGWYIYLVELSGHSLIEREKWLDCNILEFFNELSFIKELSMLKDNK